MMLKRRAAKAGIDKRVHPHGAAAHADHRTGDRTPADHRDPGPTRLLIACRDRPLPAECRHYVGQPFGRRSGDRADRIPRETSKGTLVTLAWCGRPRADASQSGAGDRWPGPASGKPGIAGVPSTPARGLSAARRRQLPRPRSPRARAASPGRP
jgi:hypothetical protein